MSLVNLAGAATFFGVSGKTIIRWQREGRLSGTKTLEGEWRFDTDELEEVLAAANQDTRP